MNMQYIENTQNQLSSNQPHELGISQQEHKYADHYLASLSEDVKRAYPHLREDDGVDTSIQSCPGGDC